MTTNFFFFSTELGIYKSNCFRLFEPRKPSAAGHGQFCPFKSAFSHGSLGYVKQSCQLPRAESLKPFPLVYPCKRLVLLFVSFSQVLECCAEASMELLSKLSKPNSINLSS